MTTAKQKSKKKKLLCDLAEEALQKEKPCVSE